MYLDHCDYWSKGGAYQLQGVCKCRKFPIAWCWQIWSAVSGVFTEKIWGSWLSTNQNINREWKVKHTLVAMLKKFELRLCKRYIRKMCPASKVVTLFKAPTGVLRAIRTNYIFKRQIFRQLRDNFDITLGHLLNIFLAQLLDNFETCVGIWKQLLDKFGSLWDNLGQLWDSFETTLGQLCTKVVTTFGTIVYNFGATLNKPSLKSTRDKSGRYYKLFGYHTWIRTLDPWDGNQALSPLSCRTR